MQQKFSTLIGMSGVDYQVTVSRPANAFAALSVGDNLLLGYSVFDLLFSLDFATGNYNGELSFQLNEEQFKKLNDHMSEVVKWSDDLALILKDLVGDDDYLELGQKPNSEILKSPISLSQNVIARLRSLDKNTPCLLFNTLSLNLKDHPNRDFLKGIFEEIYTQEGLIGANGRRKEFLHDDPYRSNLGIRQVIQICPRLNKLIKVKQLVTTFTGAQSLQEGFQALESFGVDRLETMRQYKGGVLGQIYNDVLGLHRAQIPFRGLVSFEGLSTIDEVEGMSMTLCNDFLRDYTGPMIKNKIPPHQFTPQQIEELYNGNPYKTYTGNQRHRNIVELFNTLKRSPAFVRAKETLPRCEEPLEELFDEMVTRLNKYHRLDPTCIYYGRPMIDKAVQYLEQFVAKISHQNLSRVTDASIIRSLNVLAGQQGVDLINSCEKGVAGRVNDLLIALISSSGDALRDHLDEQIKGFLDDAFRKMFGALYDSVHKEHYKESASQYLNLTEPFDRQSCTRLDQQVQNLIRLVFNEYTPEVIYKNAYTFFGEKFWQLNQELDDEGMYQLFEDLGFGTNRAELNQKYRVAGDEENRWQYAFFQQDLPQHLVPYLIKENFLHVKEQQNETVIFSKEGEGKTPINRLAHINPLQVLQPALRRAAPVPVRAPVRNLGFNASSSYPSANTGSH